MSNEKLNTTKFEIEDIIKSNIKRGESQGWEPELIDYLKEYYEEMCSNDEGKAQLYGLECMLNKLKKPLDNGELVIVEYYCQNPYRYERKSVKGQLSVIAGASYVLVETESDQRKIIDFVGSDNSAIKGIRGSNGTVYYENDCLKGDVDDDMDSAYFYHFAIKGVLSGSTEDLVAWSQDACRVESDRYKK